MSQYLPTGNFKPLKEMGDITKIPDTNLTGYILEVDLEYPKKLHDNHNDLPLAPESLMINQVRKLVPNLQIKTKYVIHYRNLKQCLKYGLKLTKIHRILSFDQSPWMKPYIDLNTKMRQQAQDEFSKGFYNLMNNCVFGKTIEHVRRRIDMKFI